MDLFLLNTSRKFEKGITRARPETDGGGERPGASEMTSFVSHIVSLKRQMSSIPQTTEELY